MSIAIDITSTRPQLRAEVVFGPPLLSRGATVYYIKNSLTSWFYRIGIKEYFLISRMDGSRTLQEIGAEYEVATQRRLSSSSWLELLKILEKRQLLVDSETPNGLEKLKKEAQKKRRKERGIFRANFALVNPDALLDRVLPWVRFAFQPAFVLLALMAIVALEVFFFLHLNPIVTNVVADFRAGTSTNVWFVLVFVALLGLVLVAHESSHALACKRFGGSVREIGIGWRYLSPFPYCKLDDVVLFSNRWHRVYTAFAGIYTNLLMLVPFAFLWSLSPEHSVVKAFSALVLLLVNFATLLNFVPFIELDGYLMLNHALNMVDLRKDSHQLWLHKIKALFKRDTKITVYAHHRYVYLIYGGFSLVYSALFTTFMALYWFGLIRLWLGNVTAWVLLPVIALLCLLFSGPGRAWLQKRGNAVLRPGAS